MFGLKDMEGVQETSSIKPQNLELSDTHKNYLAEIFPTKDVWCDMSAVDKMDIQRLLELRKDEVIEATGIYDVDFAPALPEYLFEEFNYPFCDEMEFTHKSEFAVKEFYENDSCREIPYSDADILGTFMRTIQMLRAIILLWNLRRCLQTIWVHIIPKQIQ